LELEGAGLRREEAAEPEAVALVVREREALVPVR